MARRRPSRLGDTHFTKIWMGMAVDRDMPDEILERLYSIPGVGIQTAIFGDPPGHGPGTPSLLWFTTPRDGDERAVAAALYDFGSHRIKYDVNLERQTIGIFSRLDPNTATFSEKIDWWMILVSRLEILRLPEFPPIGPFKICRVVADAPNSRVYGSRGYISEDLASGMVSAYGISVVDGRVVSARSGDCVYSMVMSPDTVLAAIQESYQTLSGAGCSDPIGYDDAVETMAQDLETIPHLALSPRDLREAISFTLRHCAQFRGALDR